MCKSSKLSLPTSKKITKKQKLQVLSVTDVENMNLKLMTLERVQRSARPFYNTTRRGNSLTLNSKTTKNTFFIDFRLDQFQYMTIKKNHSVYISIKKPIYTRDFFIKLLRYDLV